MVRSLSGRFYRVVRSPTPTLTDFYSPERQGRKVSLAATSDLLRSFRSVSVWDTLDGAARVARDYPKLGRYVAVIELPANVTALRFGAPGHWDIEAEPDELLKAVVEVVPIATVERG